jgi:phage-related protein
MKQRFEVILLGEVYGFLEKLDEKVQEKVIYNVDKSKYFIDPKLFKKLQGEIWEFRTEYRKLQHRLFAFWDKTDATETLVVATHGVIKKTDKVSQADIDKANAIRKMYFEQKLGKSHGK